MADNAPDADRIVIPLHAEEIVPVRAARDRGAIRITTRVETAPAAWEATLRRDDVTVERIPVGQVVEVAPEARWEGETLIVPVVEEELVISRRLVVREEIRIRRQSDERTVSGTEPLRRQVVDIERIGPDDDPAPSEG
ncbi:MAG TPA: YsnF/AvaK domain-containing protein [Thermomicrobiales bacterium]|jgi:uncharacterized protein (TIGR02271 family)|nr:YsnF/AvaK domain-containing protein [Thermomicrobiales bacterium]